MVWGCMSSGLGELVFIEEIMDKFIYLRILKENLKQNVKKLVLGNNYYFQYDNDPKHTADIVRAWIVWNTPHTLRTPPPSPDVNPIENIWKELRARVAKRHATNKAKLKYILLQEWKKIGANVTRKHVQNRCQCHKKTCAYNAEKVEVHYSEKVIDNKILDNFPFLV